MPADVHEEEELLINDECGDALESQKLSSLRRLALTALAFGLLASFGIVGLMLREPQSTDAHSPTKTDAFAPGSQAHLPSEWAWPWKNILNKTEAEWNKTELEWNKTEDTAEAEWNKIKAEHEAASRLDVQLKKKTEAEEARVSRLEKKLQNEEAAEKRASEAEAEEQAKEKAEIEVRDKPLDEGGFTAIGDWILAEIMTATQTPLQKLEDIARPIFHNHPGKELAKFPMTEKQTVKMSVQKTDDLHDFITVEATNVMMYKISRKGFDAKIFPAEDIDCVPYSVPGEVSIDASPELAAVETSLKALLPNMDQWEAKDEMLTMSGLTGELHFRSPWHPTPDPQLAVNYKQNHEEEKVEAEEEAAAS